MANKLSNILITSARERVILVKNFQRTAQEMGVDAKVYTCDMEPDKAPACKVSDGSFAEPRTTSEDYMQVLQSICLGNQVKIVIPTCEREVPVLSANKDIFTKLGISIFVPDYDFVMKCIDNHQFGGYLETLDIDISIPQHIDNYETLVDMYFTKETVTKTILRKNLANRSFSSRTFR